MKWIIISVVIIVVAAVSVMYARSTAKRDTAAAQLRVGEATYRVALLNDIVSQARGLSGIASMPADYGALFIFTGAEQRYFWMHDMRFPLDVVWIRDGLVVGVQENILHPAQSNGETVRFQSPEPCNWVLELNAGQIRQKGIKVGDSVEMVNT